MSDEQGTLRIALTIEALKADADVWHALNRPFETQKVTLLADFNCTMDEARVIGEKYRVRNPHLADKLTVVWVGGQQL